MRRAFIASFLFFLSCILTSAQNFKEDEVGFVFSATDFRPKMETGIGGRFLRNYNSFVGFEFTGTFYPAEKRVNFYQGTFNLKGTYRMESRYKVNIFGIVGPGFFIADPNPGKADRHFALTAGGGIEGVLHPKWAIRADFADLIIYSHGNPTLSGGSNHSDNFDFKLSLMYRW